MHHVQSDAAEVTGATLVERTRALVPILRERGRAAEESGRILRDPLQTSLLPHFLAGTVLLATEIAEGSPGHRIRALTRPPSRIRALSPTACW